MAGAPLPRSGSSQSAPQCATGAPLSPLGVSKAQLNPGSASWGSLPERQEADKAVVAARQLAALHARLGLGSLMPAAEAVAKTTSERSASTPPPISPQQQQPVAPCGGEAADDKKELPPSFVEPSVATAFEGLSRPGSHQGSRAATPPSRRGSKVSAGVAFSMVNDEAKFDMRSLLGELDSQRRQDTR